jgi:hypothetical protein
MSFIPSLELSRMLYEEQIEPLMEREFLDLPYAAATLGMCSEVLGLDDEVSMDHEWGPRLTIYLSEEDHARHGADIQSALRESLPKQFKGLDMMWRKPGVDIHDTSETALYHVRVGTVNSALRFCGGAAALPLQDVDWLRVSEQHLLEFTSGTVYRDDMGALTRARDALAYYPDDVLRFLLLAEWNAVGGGWFPIGRMGSRGDPLGVRMQAAVVCRHLMQIAFMVSRRYAPYRKWYGTLFRRLPVAARLRPVLQTLLVGGRWQAVEERICEATSILIEAQNELGITPRIVTQPKRAEDRRHYIDCDFRSIVQGLSQGIPPRLQSLLDNQVFWLHERALILWNEEVGKWPLLLQRDDT